ncbi:MAG: hypothetical protein R2856_17695 [Caldilineaceae bacterium]
MGEGSNTQEMSTVFARDEGIRRDTSVDVGQAASCLPREGDDHRGQQQPNQRRRRRSDAHV